MNCHVFSTDLHCVSKTLQPFSVHLALSKSQVVHLISQCVSVPHRTVKSVPLKNPCWTSHLNGYMYDLFRSSSSGEVFLWKPTKVPAPQCLVNSMNKGINHLSHVWSEWVKRRLLGPHTFEMPILVALGTKQPLLSHGDV